MAEAWLLHLLQLRSVHGPVHGEQHYPCCTVPAPAAVAKGLLMPAAAGAGVLWRMCQPCKGSHCLSVM